MSVAPVSGAQPRLLARGLHPNLTFSNELAVELFDGGLGLGLLGHLHKAEALGQAGFGIDDQGARFDGAMAFE